MDDPKQPPYSVSYDLANCDAEPIHFIRHYQLPAFLLVVDPQTYTVTAQSDNFPGSNGPGFSGGGKKIHDFLDRASADYVIRLLSREDYRSQNPYTVTLLTPSGAPEIRNLIINPSGNEVLLEFEPREEKMSTSSFLFRVDQSLSRVQNSGESDNLFELVVNEVKALTEYDRVMLYRFDHEYNGEVVAEARNEDLDAYLNLRYPHTDIPEQARKLFLKNSVRHIVNTDPSAVSYIVSDPADGEVNLAMSANRGSSPIHLRYLRNMGVGASLTVSIVVNQKLWGLISCHHTSPKLLDYRLRSIISLLGKVLSGHLALTETTQFRKRILGTSITRSRLYERMSEQFDIVEGLLRSESPTLTDLTGANGAAILLDGEIYLMGETPTKPEIEEIANFLGKEKASLFSTDQLFDELPAARTYQNPPAGLLSIRLTNQPAEYIMWFRPEIRKTVTWGGEPTKRKQVLEGKVDLHPELSFMKWEQQLEGRSASWEGIQLDAANSLRNDIKEVIVQKYQEARRQNGELMNAYQELETFSYTVSHDLRAPLRNIKSFAEILTEDYHEQLDDFGREALNTIVSSVGRMNNFINDILEVSRVNRTEAALMEVELDTIIDEVWSDLKLQAGKAVFRREGGGVTVVGDHIQLKQLFQNLLSNAFKYSSKVAQPEVVVKTTKHDGNALIEVTDNGIGIDMKHAENIFTVFNRLVSIDDFEGTGVGLSIAHKIVERHHGKISVDSEPGVGSTFKVILPLANKKTV